MSGPTLRQMTKAYIEQGYTLRVVQSALQRVWDTYGFDPSIDSSIWQEVIAALKLAKGEKP